MQSLNYVAHLKVRLEAARDASKGQRTRALLLYNTAVVLERHGVASDLVARACKLSKVSRGTFYTYFDDSLAAVMAVATDFLRTAEGWAAGIGGGSRDGGNDLFASLMLLLRFEARLHAENPGILRCLYVVDPLSTTNKRPYLLWQKVRHDWRVILAGELAARLGTPPRDRATLHVLYALAGMADDVLFQMYVSENPFFTRTIVDGEDMVELMAVMWFRALTGANPPSRRLNARTREAAKLLGRAEKRLA